MTSVV